MEAEPRRTGSAYEVVGWTVAAVGLALATSGCLRDEAPATSSAQRPKISFEAARDRCGVSVADTPAVKRCMAAQGWVYRHPWE